MNFNPHEWSSGENSRLERDLQVGSACSAPGDGDSASSAKPKGKFLSASGTGRASPWDRETCLLFSPADLDAPVGILALLERDHFDRLSRSSKEAAKGLTIERMVSDSDAFFAELLTRRKLRSWPEDPRTVLGGDWDLTAKKPWLPRPGLLGRLRRLVS